MSNSTARKDVRPMKKLKALREAKGLTQRELAGRCGIDYSSLSMYESGKRIPNMKTIAKLANALGCRISDLNEYGDIRVNRS